jgi:putative colanic acid biosynthesis acetyltransferase WcaF
MTSPSHHQPASASSAAPATPTSDADIEQLDALSRADSPYTLRQKLARLLWMILGQRIFALTFHNMYGPRRVILCLFGASIAPHVRIRPSVRIEQPWNLTIGSNSSVGDRAIIYCLGKVTLEQNVSISQGAHLCAGTHDYRTPAMTLLKPPITIQRDAWIAADAFVGPGVTVGQGAILGARGVAMRNLEPGWIYAGNPAQKVKPR